MGIGQVEVAQPVGLALGQRPVAIAERLIGSRGRQPGLPDEVASACLVRRRRSLGPLPVVCRGIRPADQAHRGGGAGRNSSELVPDGVVDLDRLGPMPVAGDVLRRGRGLDPAVRGVGGDGRQRHTRFENGFEPAEHPVPTAADTGRGERAAGEVAVNDAQQGQPLPCAGEGPLDAARRLGLHRRVVADVPGLNEPVRRVEHLDGPVDGGRAVGRRQGVGLTGPRRVGEGRAMEVAASEVRVEQGLEDRLDLGADIELVDLGARHDDSFTGAVRCPMGVRGRL